MSLVTHVFNVGDANFAVSHKNGVLIIEDAGVGDGKPPKDWPNDQGNTASPGIEAFRNILRDNSIHTVHTVISHQHDDHYKILPNLFKVIKEENGIGRGINVGKIFVGGNFGSNVNINEHLNEAAKNLGQAIDVRFIGNYDQNSIQKSKYSFNGGNVSNVANKRLPNGYRKKLSFTNAPGKEKYLELVLPNYFPTSGNQNSESLVGRLVSKRGGVISQTGILFGDATTGVQKNIIANNGAFSPSANWALLPHHLSKTGAQAINAASMSSGNPVGRNRVLPQNVLFLGSTSRPDVGRGALPPQFGQGGALYEQTHLTRDLGQGEVFTVEMSGKRSITNILKENFAKLMRSSPGRVLVSNIPYDMSEYSLCNSFAQFGTVKSAQIPRGNNGGSKGIGFVKMSTNDEAQRAINDHSNTDFGGRKIKVSYATRPSNSSHNRRRQPYRY